MGMAYPFSQEGNHVRYLGSKTHVYEFCLSISRVANIAAGKYNDCSTEARDQLVERLYRGMRRAIAATRKEAVREVSWKTTEVRFALRTETEFSEAYFRERVADPRLRVGLLRGNPCLDLRGGLVLQPAVGVVDLDPVHNLDHVFYPC